MQVFLAKGLTETAILWSDVRQGYAWVRRAAHILSNLEVGKHWFYAELGKLAPVVTRQGYETRALREQLGLKKTGRKLAEVWEAHQAVALEDTVGASCTDPHIPCPEKGGRASFPA